ncbi:MAG: hypothetical protein ACLR0N_16130 [Bilophila wadsworthia]
MKSAYCGPHGLNDDGCGGPHAFSIHCGRPARRLAPVGFTPQKEASPLDFALS